MSLTVYTKSGNHTATLLWDSQAGQFYVYGKTKTKLVYLNPTVMKQLEEGDTVKVGDNTVKLGGI